MKLLLGERVENSIRACRSLRITLAGAIRLVSNSGAAVNIHTSFGCDPLDDIQRKLFVYRCVDDGRDFGWGYAWEYPMFMNV